MPNPTTPHGRYLEQSSQALSAIARVIINDEIRRNDDPLADYLLTPETLSGLVTAVTLLGDDLRFRLQETNTH